MNSCILLSGGVGTRISSDIPKQYIRVNGRMMVTYALSALISSPHVDELCVVADPAWQQEIMEDLSPVMNGAEKPVFFAAPGANRQLSIWNGLQQILNTRDITAADDDVSEDTVFIHDAARPYISKQLIDACYEALPGHDGVLPVLPMKDTVYESSDGHSIDRLLDRSRIFAGQAPELFMLEKYVEANRALLPERILSINGSTEPAILAGMDVAMIPGDEKNSKVTTNADLERFREYTADESTGSAFHR